jgi:hypothetical protein
VIMMTEEAVAMRKATVKSPIGIFLIFKLYRIGDFHSINTEFDGLKSN